MTKKLTGYPSIDKPWLKYYSEEAINAPLPECTMYEYIYKPNQDNLDRIAINYYGADITYGELFDRIDKISGALEDIGVKEKDIVTVCMINSPEAIYLLFALNKIGAVANMIYGTSTEEEIIKYLSDANSKIVFTLDIFSHKFKNISDRADIDKIFVVSSQPDNAEELSAPFISWDNFIKNGRHSDTVSHDTQATAVITYTGGTTGGSKGVMLSNKAVISNVWQYCKTDIPFNRKEKWLMVFPLFIAFGVFSLMIPLSVGMTVIVRTPMTDSLADLCKTFRPDHIMYGPAYWEAFADDNESMDLSYLVEPMSGGDILHKNTEIKINNYLKNNNSSYKIMNGYGMTESGPAVSLNRKNAYKEGSLGVPFVKTVVAAFDTETGEELTYGKKGEICFCTPSMMTGYINNPEETANIIRKHSDGKYWIHSGDLGYISEDGFVHISGRLKRYMLCIADGVQKKVFSLDIEKALLKHNGVDNCAVVPVPDEKVNEAPVAFIIPKQKGSGGDELELELKQFCKDNLQEVYRPVKYIFVEKFPLTKVGKVDYITLTEMAKGNMQ